MVQVPGQAHISLQQQGLEPCVSMILLSMSARVLETSSSLPIDQPSDHFLRCYDYTNS
jgi:hypothetical protein